MSLELSDVQAYASLSCFLGGSSVEQGRWTVGGVGLRVSGPSGHHTARAVFVAPPPLHSFMWTSVDRLKPTAVLLVYIPCVGTSHAARSANSEYHIIVYL